LLLCGCGPQFGAWLYTLGLVPEQKVAAEYHLPPGPLLILVDDDLDLVQPELARTALVDELARQLKTHEIANRVTTNEEIARIRQSHKDFNTMSIREVGQAAEADTVLWMSVEDFQLENDLAMVVTPAQFTVRLKVFDANAERKQDVRLWPDNREGRFITATMSPHDVRQCASLADVHHQLAALLADKIARLFYDYTIKRQ
jgi:hypothetical protein